MTRWAVAMAALGVLIAALLMATIISSAALALVGTWYAWSESGEDLSWALVLAASVLVVGLPLLAMWWLAGRFPSTRYRKASLAVLITALLMAAVIFSARIALGGLDGWVSDYRWSSNYWPWWEIVYSLVFNYFVLFVYSLAAIAIVVGLPSLAEWWLVRRTPGTRRRKTTVTVLAALFLLLVISAPGAAPNYDCWGGALSADPMHCYALEEVEQDGLITVEGVYRDDPYIRVFLDDGDDNEDILWTLHANLAEKAHEFRTRYPSRIAYPPKSEPSYSYCRTGNRDDDDGMFACMVEETFIERQMVPWSRIEGTILLYDGGAKARLSRGGWASWQQVWPAVVGGSSGSSDTFDVSGVDLGNIPEIVCGHPEGVSGYGCTLWHEFPNLGLAGVRGGGKTLSPLYVHPIYVQLKTSSTNDPRIIAAVKNIFSEYEEEEALVIIPVKYDLGELWKWTVILNRFALSPGNTIGIAHADVTINTVRPNAGESEFSLVMYPVERVRPAEYDNRPDHRDTIRVFTYGDPQQVADVLPTLLPQLGIPADAVGIVYQYDHVRYG